MNKFIKLLLLSLIASGTLFADNKNIFINAKVAIPLIEKNDIQFIASQESEALIRGSKVVDIRLLSSTSILGNMPCSPLYTCPSQLEKYFSSLGVTQNHSLILYDNSYGVYASTLYTILESLGHQNITILDGGINAVKKLDPNQKLYNKYQTELKISMKEDNSTGNREESELISNNLLKKIEMVRPHLLIERNLYAKNREKSDYLIKSKNRSYLLSTEELKKVVQKVQAREGNITIIDSCPMVDIVGDRYGSYLSGVTPFSWKMLIDKEENSLKSKELLEAIFIKKALKKDGYNYLYCMSESSKALFMMLVMRELGYTKVKAYTGNWSTWRGEDSE